MGKSMVDYKYQPRILRNLVTCYFIVVIAVWNVNKTETCDSDYTSHISVDMSPAVGLQGLSLNGIIKLNCIIPNAKQLKSVETH